MRKYLSELFGSFFLLMIVVGSGIMGARLSPQNEAVALLANSIATGAGLFVLIQCLGPISGAHLNPVVSFIEFLWGRLKAKDFVIYCIVQILGAVLGVVLAHAMFDLPLIEVASKNRQGFHLALAEFVATFGLISVIALHGQKRVDRIPASVATYIVAAYWFTSSTSFANPAVTIARSLTNTFCGIALQGVPAFLLAQMLGGLGSYYLLRRIEIK